MELDQPSRHSVRSVAGWDVKPLAEIATIERSTITPNQIHNGQLYVGLENITSDGKFERVGRPEIGELKSNKFAFTDEHLLYGKLRPYLAKIGAPDFSGICSTDILPIRSSDQIDRRFLMHFLRTPSMVQHASNLAVGINLPRLSPRTLERFEIPLPPIQEQRRIVLVLDATDSLRAKRRQALTKLAALTQAIFTDMFGQSSARRFPMRPLGALVRAAITRGIDQPGPDFEGGVPYIKTTDFGSSTPTRESLARADPAIAARFPRSSVEEGDTVICIRATVGPALLVGADLVGVNLSRGTARVSPSSDILPGYLFSAISSDHFQRQIVRKLRGSTFLQIPLGELKALEIPLPPLALQRSLVEARALAEVQLRAQERQAAGLDALFASLQHRAFRGML